MKTCYVLKDSDIKVEQSESTKGRFKVTYGLQVKNDLTYSEAAQELGFCIFHNLACESKLDNEKD